MSKEITIQTDGEVSIVRVTPNFGRAFYYIARNGRCISRTITTKRVAQKLLKRAAMNSGVPYIPQWLREGIIKHGTCGL